MSALVSNQAWGFEDPQQRTIGQTLLATTSLKILIRMYGRFSDQDLANQEVLLFHHLQIDPDKHTRIELTRRYRDIGRYRKLLKEVGHLVS